VQSEKYVMTRSKSAPTIDFDLYHRNDLPAALTSGRTEIAGRAARGLDSLAFRIREGSAYTYHPRPNGIEIVPGDTTAATVIELDAESWSGLVQELEAPAGLLYAGRINCARGNAMQLMSWESALRALYNGRPPYDPDRLGLEDRSGKPLDVSRTFTAADDRDDRAHFLRTAGYLFVRNVFTDAEIDAFLDEADALRQEARQGDKLSWWGKNAAGEEVLCRVTRANAKPRLATLPTDERVLALKDLADSSFVHKRGEGEGVTVIYKHPQMVEGLGDIPWHRDCGMGGHAAMCPILIVSVYLVEATPKTGELTMLPGSHRSAFSSHGIDGAPLRHAVHFRARPGDVSVHYSDTMHAAPPPKATGVDTYRISAIVSFARPGAGHHRGDKSYNEVLHQRDDGQIEHLEMVAGRRRPAQA
jgi:hypothetical protein